MANTAALQNVQASDHLLVIHDFKARSPDELSLTRGQRVILVEKDDDFGDGWFLGRHENGEETGLFPAVYTTPAPKPTAAAHAARRIGAPQAPILPAADKSSQELPVSDHTAAPSVQPPSTELGTGNGTSRSTVYPPSHPHTERSFSAPLSSPVAPDTPPSNTTSGRAGPSSVAQRSISLSLGNGAHQNSPVMNETLSVIEEHITDMSTPRHSLLLPDTSRRDHEEDGAGHLHRRMSYINGQETDEEESTALTAEEVEQWDPARVAEHLEDIGADPQHCKVFREQEISGDVLLGMDQGSVMLKEFELGSIGKRLALWQKIKAVQEEVKSGIASHRSGPQFSSQTSPSESLRNRSTSVGTVLPRIPSLMESTPRSPSRQNSLRSSTKQHSKFNDSIASMPAMSDTQHPGHTPRPSAASVRSLNHARRHSSLDQALVSPTTRIPAVTESPSTNRHTKQGSFDQGWTMVPTPASSIKETPQESPVIPAPATATDVPTPSDNGMLVVSSLDLDRGYFSGNEVDNRDRNKLRKKHGAELHGRAPSDSFGTKRLSAVFRSRRAGSTDDLSENQEPSATQLFYGKIASKGRGAGLPLGHRKHSSVSPTVTKLDYGDSPSIDTVANSPTIAGSETSSIDRSTTSKPLFGRSRPTGLRAISDAISSDDRKGAASPASLHSEKDSTINKESPMQSPGSSSPSVNSKGFDIMDEVSLIKSKGQTPVVPRRKGKKATSAYTRGLLKKGPQEQMQGCDYSGWMKKKSSNLMTTWKTRLFVLRGTRLSYYYSENDTEEKGLIDISFHRVLPANDDRITGLHATMTGASASPTSPQHAQIQTAAAQDAQKAGALLKGDDSGMFIFKLVPPRAGLSKAVNFTKPTVHYFAVDNISQGRLWMAALMKATIERDEAHQVITTYKEKTISLAKAKAMRQRPPALMGDDDEGILSGKNKEQGLNISYGGNDDMTENATITTNGEKEGSFTTGGASTSERTSIDNVEKTSTSTTT